MDFYAFLDESDEQTTIIDSLGEHFDFYELMGAPLDWQKTF